MKAKQLIELPMWRGFRPGRGEACDGSIEVDYHGSRITDRQRAAVRATVKRAAAMKPRVLDAIVLAYPTFRAWDRRPKMVTKAQLKARIALWQVLVTTDHWQDLAYVAYEFSVAWDPSGVTVLTHGDRVIAAGDYELLRYPHVDPMRGVKAKKPMSPAKQRAAIATAKKREAKNPRRLDDDTEFEIHLAAWAGLSTDGTAPSKGDALVVVASDGPGDDEIGAPHEAAYRHTLTRSTAMQKLVIAALGDRRDVELTSIHIHETHRDGLAYVGYELACGGDSEHGAGVLTHGNEVVAVGQADTAFLGWVAKKAKKAKKKRR